MFSFQACGVLSGWLPRLPFPAISIVCWVLDLSLIPSIFLESSSQRFVTALSIFHSSRTTQGPPSRMSRWKRSRRESFSTFRPGSKLSSTLFTFPKTNSPFDQLPVSFFGRLRTSAIRTFERSCHESHLILAWGPSSFIYFSGRSIRYLYQGWSVHQELSGWRLKIVLFFFHDPFYAGRQKPKNSYSQSFSLIEPGA